MVRARFVAAVAFLVLALSPYAVRAADPVRVPDTQPIASGGQNNAVAPGTLAPAPQPGIYGPIQSKDPLVRAQIKHVYEQLAIEQSAALDAIRKLNQQLVAATDPDFRFELAHKLAVAKAALEHRRMELGLQIAQLDSDAIRVAQFSLALDQLDHPEKYLPKFVPDPANLRPAPSAPQK